MHKELEQVQKELAIIEELLTFRDGTRPQLVRGQATLALDRVRTLRKIVDGSLPPFEPPYTVTA